MSSLHKTVQLTDSENKKPETIIYYNQTKYGVDVADQMAKKYSTKFSSRRWPVQVFLNILDLAGLNAWIIYKETTGKKISRLNFLMDLAESLRSPYIASKNMDASRKNRETPNQIDKQNNNETGPCNTTRKRKISHGDSTDWKCCCTTRVLRNALIVKKIICGKCTTYEQRWCSK